MKTFKFLLSMLLFLAFAFTADAQTPKSPFSPPDGIFPQSYRSSSVAALQFYNSNLWLQTGDVLFAYVAEDGNNYYINSVAWDESHGISLYVWMDPPRDPSAPPDIRTGAEKGDILQLAVLRNDKVFEVIPHKLFLYGNNILIPEDRLIADQVQYAIITSDIGRQLQADFKPVPYITWFNSQCPSWKDYDGEKIDKPDPQTRYTLSRLFHLRNAIPYFVEDFEFELQTGSGLLSTSNAFNQNKYEFSKNDILRGFVEFRIKAIPLPLCNEDVSFKTVKIYWDTPEPAPVPVNDFDRTLFSDQYLTVGLKDGFIGVQNKSSEKIWYKIKVVSSSWRNVSGTVYPGNLDINKRARERTFRGNLLLEYKFYSDLKKSYTANFQL